MTTVFHRDGNGIAGTHYCSLGNQPRFLAQKIEGNKLMFEFVGGTSLDPAKDRHMHRRQIDLATAADESVGGWEEWVNGKVEPEYTKKYRLVRKTSP